MASFLFRSIRVLVVLGISLAAAVWLFNAKERPGKQEVVRTPPGVNVISATPRTLAMAVEAFGTVVPRTKVNLAAEVAGRIDYIHPSFREGGEIRKNDRLIGIDQRTFRLDRDAARVRVAAAGADVQYLTREIENLKTDAGLARTNMDLSRKELDRIRALSKNQFASKTSLDKAEQQYLAAKIQLQSVDNRLALTPSRMAQKRAALAMARNDLAKAELILEKSEIRAGFYGFVLAKQAELGEYVNPGQVLGAVYERDALDVDVGIPFEEVKWIRDAFDAGDMPRADVSIANLEGGQSPVWQARVARLKARIDEKTRTLPLTVEIGAVNSSQPHTPDPSEPSMPSRDTNPLMRLKPGTFVRCRIFGKSEKNIFQLPRYLLRPEDTLFVVSEGRLDVRKVGVLRKFEQEVYVNGGLKSGDQIITSPLPGAVPGMAVTVKSRAGEPL